MKKIITSTLLALVAFAAANAQGTLTIQSSKYPFSVYKKIHDAAAQNDLISLLVKGNVESVAATVAALGGVYKYSTGDISSVRIPANKINELAAKPFVQRMDGCEGKIQNLNDTAIFTNDVYLVQHGVGLPQSYNGEGVCIGIIDEGIDFNHKDLRDLKGNTRIKWLWDQRLPLDTNYTPQPYGYGQNFTNTQIDNLEAGNVVDHEYSHGTHVTGIAAGNGVAVNNYRGVAPKADIVFVAVNENTSDNNFLTTLVDAVQYVFSKADSMHEPCAINISLGTYFGSHDALDLQAQAIGNLIAAKTGRFISVAAGNEGNAPIHLHTDVTPDSSFTWFGGYTTNQALYFELWSDSADIANIEWMVAADQTTPYNTRGETSFSHVTSSLGYDSETIFSGGNPLGLVETYVDYSFGRYSFICQITPDSANYRWRFMTRGTGKFDAWSNDLVPGALPDSVTFPLVTKYKLPDTDQNICTSFTCSPKVITVGSYANRNHYADVNDVQEWDTMPVNGGNKITVGSLSGFSSHGPTRDGRIKPEITATGEWVLSCAATYDLNSLYLIAPNDVAAGGQHKRGTGTSMASPEVAGTAALYFQKNPTASYQEVKDAIMGCSRTDQFTNASPLPNNHWGYGKLDAYKAIKGCAVGIDEAYMPANVFFENYPNPFTDQTTIHYDLSSLKRQNGNAIISISDAVGRKVHDIAITGQEGNIVVNKNGMGSGVYFYSLILDGKIIRTNKLMVM